MNRVKARTVVLVEGLSDKAAVEALAGRMEADLQAMGILVVSMGGATNVGRFLERYTRNYPEVNISGLYDEAEEIHVRAGLERAGITSPQLEDQGFFMCVADLEDEMIRSLGVERVLDVVTSEGELAGFRVMQGQPHWRERNVGDQLHRFIGIRSGRKIRYGGLLAGALDLSRIPRPLEQLMRHLDL